MVQHDGVHDQADDDPDDPDDRDMTHQHCDGLLKVPRFLRPNCYWPKKIFVFFHPEQNLEAGVDNPWGLQTHAEAEKEPRCGGAPVSGGHGLETGEEDTASCQPDDDCVSQGGVPEMRFKIPEEESLQHKSQNIDIACTLFGK